MIDFVSETESELTADIVRQIWSRKRLHLDNGNDTCDVTEDRDAEIGNRGAVGAKTRLSKLHRCVVCTFEYLGKQRS